MAHGDQQLAAAWAKRYEIIAAKTEESPEAAALFWAFQELDDLCERQPRRALGVIAAIAHQSDNDFVLENLAAGPLESLLARNGTVIIDDVEREAHSDAKFRELLCGVWSNMIDDDVWRRVELCRGATT